MDNQNNQGLALRLPQDGQIYKGVNTIAHGCTYKVIKVNKTTCWVRLLQDGIPTNTIYKGVRFHHLGKLLVDVPQIVGYTTNEPVYVGLEESDKPVQAASESTTDEQDNTLLQTNISIEEGTTIPYDGKVSVWQWNKDTYNQYLKVNRPVWEFLTPEQVFYLCLYDVITVPKQVIEDNFTEEKSY